MTGSAIRKKREALKLSVHEFAEGSDRPEPSIASTIKEALHLFDVGGFNLPTKFN